MKLLMYAADIHCYRRLLNLSADNIFLTTRLS